MVVGLARAALEWAGALPFWGALAALVAIEMWRPLHDWPEEPRGRIAGNVGMGFINAGLTLVLPLSTVVSAGWAAHHHLGLMNLVALPAAIPVVATLLLRSLATYGVHRLSHAVPLLWRVHRVHHSDTRVDLSTGFRNHPLDLAIAAPCLAAATIACGFDAPTLVAYESVAVVFALWTHANFRLPERLDRRLRILLVTPAMHGVHHTSRREEHDCNYGDVLSLWDRLFGTYLFVPADALVTRDFGLGDASEEEAASFVRQLRTPFYQPGPAPVPAPSEA
jgi:sterol desaturase/sphingolipid hydroxylase (fatty acid hydroxylase superfamily)